MKHMYIKRNNLECPDNFPPSGIILLIAGMSLYLKTYLLTLINSPILTLNCVSIHFILLPKPWYQSAIAPPLLSPTPPLCLAVLMHQLLKCHFHKTFICIFFRLIKNSETSCLLCFAFLNVSKIFVVISSLFIC